MPARGQETQAPPAAQQQLSEEHLIQLNEGIAAFQVGDYEDAKRILEALAEKFPDHPGCLYHLGLIYLQDGLAAGDDTPERMAAFTQAREHLKRVIELADRERAAPGVIPFPDRAALDLSIAQLASADEQKEEEEIALDRSAAALLKDYIETPLGRADRYGYFYLGIAYYRLLRLHVPGFSAAEARSACIRALNQADADAQRGVLDETEHAHFKTTVR